MRLYAYPLGSIAARILQVKAVMSVEAATRMELDQDQLRGAIKRIVSHLSEYPLSRDTVRGVAEWWAESSTTIALEALHFLLTQGIVEEFSRHGQILYARNSAVPQAELKTLLAAL